MKERINNMDMRARFLKTISPLTIFFGKIQSPESEMPDMSYEKLVSVINPGDVLLSRRTYSLSNIGIPGFYKHAVLYVGNGKIIEAIGKGVQEVSLARWIYTYDHAICLRPLFASKEGIDGACSFAINQRGKKYDYEFSPGIQSFYCSELVYYSYIYSMPESPFTLRKSLGVDTVVPEDFLKASSKFKQVWKS